MIENNSYTAVIIAAGLSSRMDGFKPLMDVGGEPALFRLLDTVRAAGIGQTVVVMGYGRRQIDEALERYRAGQPQSGHRIMAIYNEGYESGMFSSIRAGIRSAAEMPGEAALLFPVDIPLVAAGTVRGLIRAFERGMAESALSPEETARLGASGLEAIGPGAIGLGAAGEVTAGEGLPAKEPEPRFAVPVYQGKNGHPLLIPRPCFDEISAYAGAGGLKDIRNKYGAGMIRYETGDLGCVLDMDTPEDYARIVEYAEHEKLI